MTQRIAIWRTLAALRQRRIDGLEKERSDALRAWQRSQAAHEAAREARQDARAACDAHDEGTRRMMTGEKGFLIGDYLDRLNYAPILKGRLDLAAARMRAAADEESTRMSSVDALRQRIQRENTRLGTLKEWLAEEIRLQDEMRREAEDEEIAEASAARRMMERGILTRQGA